MVNETFLRIGLFAHYFYLCPTRLARIYLDEDIFPLVKTTYKPRTRN